MSIDVLPIELYQNDQIRTLEKIAIEQHSITEDELMQRAGEGAFTLLREACLEAEQITVFCGPGNNGGDGYVLAKLAAQAGYAVQVYYLGDLEQLKGAAKNAALACEAADVEIQAFDADIDLEADVIVDALLGTGLQREVTGEFAEAIELINEQDVPVLAIDIPSGLECDTGHILGNAVVADFTITMIGLKIGLLTGQGPECAGVVLCDNLEIPEMAYIDVAETAVRLELEDVVEPLGTRSRVAHKGDFGHVLIIGGNYGMPGSVQMAAQAAARVGAGLVTVATRPEHISVVAGACPEIMCHGINQPREIQALLEDKTVVVVGPGLGRDEWAQELFKLVTEAEASLIVDADALYHLHQDEISSDDWILTPHPGEAGRLLGVSAAEVQADRLSAIEDLQAKFGGVIILKGAGSLVLGTDDLLGLCNAGNPGMATAGMGDVLSGILGGLVAQGLSLEAAAQAGVCIHAQAGDLAAEEGERGTMATDLMPFLRDLVNEE